MADARIEIMAEGPNPGALDICTVTLNGETRVSTEYIAILTKPDGDAAFYYNADALTMGMAMRLCAKAFADMLNKLDELERNEINEILGGKSNEQNS